MTQYRFKCPNKKAFRFLRTENRAAFYAAIEDSLISERFAEEIYNLLKAAGFKPQHDFWFTK